MKTPSNKQLRKGILLILIVLLVPQAVSATTISSVTGTLSHGATITINGSGFGIKSNPTQAVPAAPLVWDITSEQYVGGVNRNAYANVADGSSLLNYKQVWQKINDGEDSNIFYSTSRSHRSPFLSAHYTAITGPSGSGKFELGTLRYPDGSAYPPASQKTIYLSFYRKLKNGYGMPGGGDGSAKMVRINSANAVVSSAAGCLSHFWYGSSGMFGGQSWIDIGNETTWVRWEIYLDYNRAWFDAYKNGHYILGENSSAPGNIEVRPAADWRFRVPGINGFAWNNTWLPTGDGINIPLFGYDDGHSLSQGQEIDVSEIYMDNTQARVEISDQPVWNDSPTSTAKREVQGRLLSWSDTSISLSLYQGAFTTGQTVYAYVIDENGNVNQNGYPATIGAGQPDTTPPAPPSGVMVN